MAKMYLGRFLAWEVVDNALALYAALKMVDACEQAKNVFDEPTEHDLFIALKLISVHIYEDEFLRGWISAVRRLNLDPLWADVAKTTLVSAIAAVKFERVDIAMLEELVRDKRYSGLLNVRLRKTFSDGTPYPL